LFWTLDVNLRHIFHCCLQKGHSDCREWRRTKRTAVCWRGQCPSDRLTWCCPPRRCESGSRWANAPCRTRGRTAPPLSRKTAASLRYTHSITQSMRTIYKHSTSQGGRRETRGFPITSRVYAHSTWANTSFCCAIANKKYFLVLSVWCFSLSIMFAFFLWIHQ